MKCMAIFLLCIYAESGLVWCFVHTNWDSVFSSFCGGYFYIHRAWLCRWKPDPVHWIQEVCMEACYFYSGLFLSSWDFLFATSVFHSKFTYTPWSWKPCWVPGKTGPEKRQEDIPNLFYDAGSATTVWFHPDGYKRGCRYVLKANWSVIWPPEIGIRLSLW